MCLFIGALCRYYGGTDFFFFLLFQMFTTLAGFIKGLGGLPQSVTGVKGFNFVTLVYIFLHDSCCSHSLPLKGVVELGLSGEY